MLLLLIGVILAAILPFLSLIYLPLFTVVIVFAYLITNKEIKYIKLTLALMVIIFVYFSSQSLKANVDQLSNYLDQGEVELLLEITSDNGDFATAKVIQYRGIENKSTDNILIYTEESFQPGSVYGFTGNVRNFNEYKNPATHSKYSTYLYRNYGYITPSSGRLEILKQGTVQKEKFSIRNFMENRLSTLSPNTEALARGVLLGDRGQLSLGQVEDFKNSGLIHITAVSGLHIGIIYMVFRVLAKPFMAKKYTILIGYIGAIIFATIVGFRPSTLRAIMMLSIYSIANIKGYPYSLERALQVTALLNIIYNPFIILDLGFQFSYMAVGGIVYIAPKLTFIDGFPNKYIASILKVTVAIQIALLPLNFFHSRGIPLLTPIANILIAPLLPVFLTLLLLFVLLPISIIKIPIELMAYYILGISQITSYWLTINTLAIFVIIISILIYFISHKIKGKKIKLLISVLLVFIVILVSISQPHVQVHFLDVGQGDSAIIQYKGYNILVDTGGIMGANIGERVLLPTFSYLGINKLDYIFLTHPHYDHIGALTEIVGHINIGQILIPDNDLMYSTTFLNVLEEIKDYPLEIIPIKKGDNLQIGNFNKKVLYPTKEFSPRQSPANNISLVTLLKYRETTILFTGDIEAEAENYISSLLKPVDILKVAHHGSNTSTSDDFLQKTTPESAIISVGNNRYGHPSPDVMQRLEDMDINALTTQDDGMITVKIYRTGRYKIESYVR